MGEYDDYRQDMSFDVRFDGNGAYIRHVSSGAFADTIVLGKVVARLEPELKMLRRIVSEAFYAARKEVTAERKALMVAKREAAAAKGASAPPRVPRIGRVPPPPMTDAAG